MKIDGYEIQSEIARGSQGIVYVARDVRSGRRVALKVLLEISQSVRRRFEREAEILARLRHPNVVAIHGAGRAQGRPYIVMEFVEGMSLREALNERGAFEQHEAARIVRDLARGAGQAHLQGLVHRDIKPANALLRPDATVLLTDFGLARDQENVSDLSKTGVFMGTPGFASPEQASGEGKRVGPASDVYGLGALLFALLCERPPIEGDLLEVVIATISTPPPSPREFNPEVDPALATICLRCLAKRPEERYADGSALAEELERYLRGEAIAAIRSPQTPFALAALGLLCVIGVGGAALYALDPTDPTPTLASAPPAPSHVATATPRTSPLSTPRLPPTPAPALERTLRLARGKTRPDELDSAIEILSEALERAAGASNRVPSEQFLADLYTRRADQVMQRGPAEVSADLRRAATLDPSPRRRAALAEALMRQGLHVGGGVNLPERWPPARKLLREAMELAPGDLRMPMTLGEQARIRKDWEVAQLGFGEAYRGDPQSVNALAGLAQALGKRGRTREGLVVVRDYLKTHPKSQTASCVLGLLLSDQGRWFEARAAYRAVGKRSSYYERARLGLAWIALEEDRPTRAIELLEGVRGKKFEAIAIRGIGHLSAKDYGRAQGALQGVMEMTSPDTRLAWAYLRALYGAGKHKQAGEAVETLVQSAALPPARLLFFRANHLARLGEHPEAGETFQSLYRHLLQRPDPWAAIEMGERFSQWGRYHKPSLTVELAKLAAAASPDDEDARAWTLQAKGLLLQHSYPAARELLERAARVHPTRVDLHHTLAGVESGARRFEASIAAAARCLELEPTSVYSAVIGAESCLGAGRYADAKPFLAACLSELKSNSIPRALRAVMHIELGDPAAAEEDVAWVTKREPDRPHSMLAQAALLVARGRYAEALALAEPVSQRPDRGWPPVYARVLLERIRKSRE